MTERPARRDVFISYSSADKTWADAATAVLERQRIRCWVAPRDITPGMEWGAAIIEGIDTSRVMVLIFSERANASPQVRREVERAVSKGLAVLPFRIENVAPAGAMEYALGNTHWLDAFTPPAERQLERLADAVQALLGRPLSLPPPPPPRARSRPAQPVSSPPPARTARQPATTPAPRGRGWLVGAVCALILIAGAVGGGLYYSGVFRTKKADDLPAGGATSGKTEMVVREIDARIQNAGFQKPGTVTLTPKQREQVLRNVSVTVTLTHTDLLALMVDVGIDTTFAGDGKIAKSITKNHTPPAPTVLKITAGVWSASQPIRLVIPDSSMPVSSVLVIGTADIDGRPVRIDAVVSIPLDNEKGS